MKIALGTGNEYKLELLKEVLKTLGVEAEVIGSDIPSGVSDQPVGSAVTKRGALNRAKGALGANKESDCGIGLEVGYQKTRDGLYEMMCWAVVFDGKETFAAKSHALLLPKFHQEVLREGKYLGEHVRDFVPEESDLATEKIRDIIIYRKPFMVTAAENALVLYLNRRHYR